MTLTVANRIRLGFASILLMLIFISGNSLYNFIQVEKETNHSKNLSLPALEMSTKLEAQLMIIQRLALEEYYSETISDIDKHHNTLIATQKNVNQLIEQLQTISNSDKTLSSKLPPLLSSVSDISKTTTRLYAKKKSVLSVAINLENSLSQLSEVSDNLSSTLLDITDTESEDPHLETLIGLANDLDNLMLTLIKTSEDLSKQSNAVRTVAIAKELTFINADVTSKLTFLIRNGGFLLYTAVT